MSHPILITNAIREVTGRSPQSLEEFFRANAKSMVAEGHVGGEKAN